MSRVEVVHDSGDPNGARLVGTGARPAMDQVEMVEAEVDAGAINPRQAGQTVTLRIRRDELHLYGLTDGDVQAVTT